jgi:hypothetical protein
MHIFHNINDTLNSRTDESSNIYSTPWMTLCIAQLMCPPTYLPHQHSWWVLKHILNTMNDTLFSMTTLHVFHSMNDTLNIHHDLSLSMISQWNVTPPQYCHHHTLTCLLPSWLSCSQSCYSGILTSSSNMLNQLKIDIVGNNYTKTNTKACSEIQIRDTDTGGSVLASVAQPPASVTNYFQSARHTHCLEQLSCGSGAPYCRSQNP